MGQSAFDAITGWRAPSPARLQHDDVHAAFEATHLLCVQELLSHHAQRFFDAVGPQTFVSRIRDHNRPSLRPASLRGTGLGMAARSPLLDPTVRHFPTPRSGWDILARKGILHARLALPDGPKIDVLTTHLQAGYGDEARSVRATQLQDLSRVIDAVSAPDRPFVVCGDFNIDGLEAAREKDEYRRLTAALPGFLDLGALADEATYDPHPSVNALAHFFEPETPRQRLDYVFLRPAPGLRFSHTAVERFLDRALSPRGAPAPEFASDHFGVCATFEY